jgi:mono/diheme cytochrome c family protein
VIRVLPISGTLRVLAVATLLSCLVAGCSTFDSLDSVRYPSGMAYPQRQDLLVKDKPGIEVRTLPPPGEMDLHIRRASKEPGAKMFDPADLDKGDARDLRAALRAVFGTPRNPRVAPKAGSDELKEYETWQGKWMSTLEFSNAEALATVIAPGGEAIQEDEDQPGKPTSILGRGSVLYRRHCLHCHGLTGDGRGPTGPWVNPHPRDYRRGLFKFISTGAVGERKPRREDLYRIIHNGIDGTSMPAFGLLPEHEIQYLVSYVIHLSIRGQTEYETMLKLLEGGKDNLTQAVSDTPLDITQFVLAQAAQLRINWAKSTDAKPYEAPAYTEPEDNDAGKMARHDSIRKGHQIFLGTQGGCIACHQDYGRQVPYKYDDWGTLVRPANLTVSTYRGGRRPIDFFWRIKGGIPPAGMPAAPLPDADYWHLVNFVRALPYPAMLPEDVRKAVYGSSAERKPQEKQALLTR